MNVKSNKNVFFYCFECDICINFVVFLIIYMEVPKYHDARTAYCAREAKLMRKTLSVSKLANFVTKKLKWIITY